MMDLQTQPHRRYNPLTGEWIQVSPHRMLRPWQGQMDPPVQETRPAHDPACYLCPGNERAGGQTNPVYEDVYVFDNDFAALLDGRDEVTAPQDVDDISPSGSELLHAAPVQGTCRVICFSPRHDLTLAHMATHEVRTVIDVWARQVEQLRETYRWIQVFENKGAMMGCSNPHPHGQIWALDAMPNEAVREDRMQAEYRQAHGATLLQDYAVLEDEEGERVVERNEHWVAVVPFWAVWPFEILLVPRRPVMHLDGLADDERTALAHIMSRVLRRYDALFSTSFPYSMGWHGAPAGAVTGATAHWHLHAHFYPPLLRSASVRKFMVGYELLAEAQRDLTAERAAARLRELEIDG